MRKQIKTWAVLGLAAAITASMAGCASSQSGSSETAAPQAPAMEAVSAAARPNAAHVLICFLISFYPPLKFCISIIVPYAWCKIINFYDYVVFSSDFSKIYCNKYLKCIY